MLLFFSNFVARDAPLVKVHPNVDGEDHHEKDTPAGQCADASADALLIEQESDSDRTDNLREPVDEVVERPCTDIEQRPIVIIELCPHPGHVR